MFCIEQTACFHDTQFLWLKVNLSRLRLNNRTIYVLYVSLWERIYKKNLNEYQDYRTFKSLNCKLHNKISGYSPFKCNLSLDKRLHFSCTARFFRYYAGLFNSIYWLYIKYMYVAVDRRLRERISHRRSSFCYNSPKKKPSQFGGALVHTSTDKTQKKNITNTTQ